MPISITIENKKRKRKTIDVNLQRLSDLMPRGIPRSPSHLSRVIRGKTNPSIPCISAIATALGLTVDETLTKIEEKKFRIRRSK